MAHMEGNKLVADEAGEPYLRVYVAPFGGEKLICLRISSERKPLDPEPSAEPTPGPNQKPSGNGSANTSDSNSIPLYTGILGISLLAVIALILNRRKQNN